MFGDLFERFWMHVLQAFMFCGPGVIFGFYKGLDVPMDIWTIVVCVLSLLGGICITIGLDLDLIEQNQSEKKDGSIRSE